jgi:hypothetical protein
VPPPVTTQTKPVQSKSLETSNWWVAAMVDVVWVSELFEFFREIMCSRVYFIEVALVPLQ